MTKYRNGVEALPSLLRRKYKVDQMPVRGKKFTKLYFGFKVGALNISKFCEAMKRRDKCAQKQKEEEKWTKANAENETAIEKNALSLEYILTNYFKKAKLHFMKYAFDA